MPYERFLSRFSLPDYIAKSRDEAYLRHVKHGQRIDFLDEAGQRVLGRLLDSRETAAVSVTREEYRDEVTRSLVVEFECRFMPMETPKPYRPPPVEFRPRPAPPKPPASIWERYKNYVDETRKQLGG